MGKFIELSKQWLCMLGVAMFLVACGGDGKSPPADSDGDGILDSADAFPNDASETVDSDGDGVGDNSDPAPEDGEVIGKMVETLDWDLSTPETDAVLTTTFGANGYDVEVVKDYDLTDSETYTSISIRRYDDTGENELYVFNKSLYGASSSTTWEYNEMGDVVSQQSKTGDIMYGYAYEYEYDESGNMVVKFTDNNATGTFDFKHLYTYDELGNVTREVEQSLVTKGTVLIGVKPLRAKLESVDVPVVEAVGEYVATPGERVVIGEEVVGEDVIGEVEETPAATYQTKTVTKYTYNADSTLQKKVLQRSRCSNCAVSDYYTYTYAYDANSYLTQEVSFSNWSNATASITYYTHDAQGNETYQARDWDADGTLDEIVYMQFDDNGNMTRTDRDNNGLRDGMTSFVTTLFSFDENSRRLSEEYDSTSPYGYTLTFSYDDDSPRYSSVEFAYANGGYTAESTFAYEGKIPDAYISTLVPAVID